MLGELRVLLATCAPGATRSDYLRVYQEDNGLGKRTVATRKLSSQRLSELYALDPGVPLFRSMRCFWYADVPGQPVLALLRALARDPLLHATALPVFEIRPGEELVCPRLRGTLSREAGDRLDQSSINKAIRNAVSSWTQSRHFEGRGHNIRRKVPPTPGAAAFAMLGGT